ncbi:globin domain-containing protein [Streptomyces sp. NBC_00986]|uniref:globin domain-containing protein n=1 Tax=Streptomyces sp. NBC_00986 TaxID=2903702 RepID=UPI003865C7C4|nr:FAD-binding oxidoreductase [Streptomyces sp. NBC_00986]
MDAPTTPSADNGTSGGSGGGGWFTPRKQPEVPPGEERGATEGRRPAVLRPVRRGAAAGSTELPPTDGSAPSTPPAPLAPPALSTPPVSAAPPVPTAPSGDGVASHPDGHAAQRDLAAGQQRIPSAVTAAQRSTPVQTSPPVQSSSPAPRMAPGPASAAPPPPAPQPAAAPAPVVAEVAQAQAAPAPVPAPVRVPAQRSSGAATATEKASPDAVLIRRTMAEVGPVADKVTSYFYALLFVRHPELRSLFPAAMDTQRDRLLKALLTAAEHIDNTEVLVAYLQNLGRGHRKYGTRPEHYPAVGECLIGALSKYASGVWDAEMEAAWVRAYTTISQVMIDAAAADELRAPPWWHAEVVTHDLRTRDVAVVTLRPDQPYPFLAGQYTSLETPWWPRIWRHYSFASAPRSDGLLTFHVKAVPAGWVSNALVHRARPGDVIRLGPPTGSMTVDHTTDSGLLCVGGGTGIAPIKALVEDVAERGERRPVEVFYGARTDHDLYDIDTMLRLQQSHPWLAVRPIVDRQGNLQLPDAIRTYGPWNEFDAYVSGPPGMIRSGVHALRDAGFPTERIRHDSVEELVAAGD